MRPAASPKHNASDERRDPPSGEHFDPEPIHGQIRESAHLTRYAWAAQLAPGRRALDAACGTGRGTMALARADASEVVGIDLNEDVVSRAGESAPSGVRFDVGDLHELPYKDDDFDLVVCFDAIEHATDPERVLDELHRVVKPDGVVAISTPNGDIHGPGDPLNVRPSTRSELEAQLATRFRSVSLYCQHTWLASGVVDDEQFRAAKNEPIEGAELRKDSAEETGQETVTVALAGDGDLPNAGPMVSLAADLGVREWSRRVERAQQKASEAAHRTAASSEAEREFLRREVAELRTQLATGEAEIARLAGIEAQLAAVAPALREREALVSSLSWRLTRPLRALGARIRRP